MSTMGRLNEPLRLWHVLLLAALIGVPVAWAADSRITALTELTDGNVATGDFLEIVDVSDTTDDAAGSSRKVTVQSLESRIHGAGSASAGSWPVFGSGTLLTTAEDGALEQDADVFYLTTDAGNRGAVGAFYITRQAAARTLTSATTEQALFDAANDTLTLETGTYIFRCELGLTGMSATSGNAAFDFIGAGTATASDILYHVVGVDGASGTAATQTGSWAVTQQTAASMVTAGTATAMVATITGNFEITVAGTIIPSVSLVTAAAATVVAGTYCRFMRGGATGMTLVGQWG